jgi:hypothetical protein
MCQKVSFHSEGLQFGTIANLVCGQSVDGERGDALQATKPEYTQCHIDFCARGAQRFHR